ncbi:MAG: Gfo/Idh/MocA family oxidoreductase [Bryobacterales bacterium]|nr:Gfo/Idh/MocA family oxidoreductase [Bryobacterales bacterium]
MPTRRSLLQTAGAAVVYQLADKGPVLRAASVNDQVNLGFIGSGIRGTQLIEDHKSIAGVNCLAVVDLYDGCLQRAKEQINGQIMTGKDYRAILDRKDIDAVVIAVPDHLHKKLTLDALSAGKHVYIEKPMTWSLAEGPQIIAAEKAAGKVLQVGSQAKSSALTAKAREIVKSGQLGRVHMVRMSNHRNNAQGAWKYAIPPDASPETIDWPKFLGHYKGKPFDARTFFQWRCWWEYSGGVATDLYVHLLTWLHEVMQVEAPRAVSSHGGIFKWNDGRTVPDYMNTLFDYDGFVADVYVNLETSVPSRPWTIHGTDAAMWEERGKLVVTKEPVDNDVQGYGTYQWPKAMREQYYIGKGYLPNGRPKEPLPPRPEPETITIDRGLTHAEHFIQSIRTGKPSVENATEGHYAAGAAHVANASYRQKRRLEWNHKTNKVRG